jgi:spermidine/putrescine transport system substrate-binding protein
MPSSTPGDAPRSRSEIRRGIPDELQPLVGALSRRNVLRGGAVAGVGLGLAACGTGGSDDAADEPSASLTPAEDGSADDPTLNFANWTLYIDLTDDGSSSPTLQEFEEESGIDVEYSEDIEDNNTYFGRIQGQLANGQDIGQDIIVFTDWMAARCIRLGYVQQLDEANIPNKENLLPNLQEVDFDPGRQYSLTWQSGFGLLAWNQELFPDGLVTLDDLWNPELRGRVEVLSEMRDTIGLIMMSQGVDISGDWGDDEFAAALAVLEEQIANGQIRQVRGNSYADDLVSEDAIAVIGWSGDIVALNFETDGKFGFAIPESGGTLWSDNCLVPIGSPRKANAEQLINHYYDPEIAARVAAYVNYITPVDGAREAMQEVDPSLVDNQLIFPNEETLATVSVFRSLTPEEETRYQADFQRVIGN